jgi:hypothetical protein
MREKKRIDPTSMPAVDPIIGMNSSSSQTELVQSWGLGHSGPNLTQQTRYPHNGNVPNTMQLSFTPLASCYATMAMHELLQTSTSVGFPFLHFVLKFTAPNRSCAKHKSLPTDLSSWNAIFHSCSLASVCNKHHPWRKKRKITSYFLQVAFHKTL